MYIRLLFFMAIIMFHDNCFGQWNMLSQKTRFTFSLTRIKTNNERDDTLSIERKSIPVVLDTILNLRKGRMFVFDKCLNGILFNSSVNLMKGKIKDKDYDELDALYGKQLIDGQQDFSSKQITVFYQLDSFIYVITMPKYFRKTVVNSHANVLEIDRLLASDVIDTVGNDMKNYRIMFMGYNIPVIQLLSIDEQVEGNSESDSPLYSLAKVEQIKTEYNSDKVYVYERSRRAAITGRLFFNSNWLIRSESLAYTQKYTYFNLVDIKIN